MVDITSTQFKVRFLVVIFPHTQYCEGFLATYPMGFNVMHQPITFPELTPLSNLISTKEGENMNLMTRFELQCAGLRQRIS
jgi:hypothetical protein